MLGENKTWDDYKTHTSYYNKQVDFFLKKAFGVN